jgi:4-amino-4-deoxy-L-arabinose transferase-like glycosyltransferase
MVFGYNGLGRFGLFSTRQFVADFGGPPGPARLIGPLISVDVAWFLPLALAGLALGLWQTRREPRTGTQRYGYLLFGLWLVPSIAVLTFATGIHTFYALLLAPPIAALAGASARQGIVWFDHGHVALVASGLILQASWSIAIIARSGRHGWLIPVVAVSTVTAVGAIFFRSRSVVVAAAGLALLAAPVVWAIGTIAHVDPVNPSAGTDTQQSHRLPVPAGPAGTMGPSPVPSSGRGSTRGSEEELLSWLRSHEPGSRYLVALGSRQAGELILAGAPGVFALGGGFDGSDPTPTADELADLVTSGELRYVMVGGAGPDGYPMTFGAPDASAGLGSVVTVAREAWVRAQCILVTAAPKAAGELFDCSPRAQGS